MSKILIPLYCLFILQPCFSQEWTRELDSILHILEEDQLFHGQILIAEQDEIIFHKSYGNLPDTNEQITTKTPLAVKSITKSFTAAAILNLEQEGKLKLTDAVAKYLRDWPYPNMDIQHLLSMTSGLPDFISHVVKKGDTTKYMDNQDIVDVITQHPVYTKKAGKFYDYQNSNYIMLAAIIETASGQPFRNYVNKKIIEPLGLQNTYLQDLTTISKTIDGNTFYAPSGDGNLYSTALDLYKFEQAIGNNQIISKKNKARTFERTKLSDGSLSNYGLAWWTAQNDNEQEYYIIGDGPNIRSSIQRYPETNSTFIYIHNVSGRYWEDVYWIVNRIWKGLPYTLPENINKLNVYNINPKLLDKYVGRYDLTGFGLIHITKKNGNLYLRPDAVPGKEQLIPSSNTTFYFKEQNIEWEFFLNKNGQVIGFGFKGKSEAMGLKIE